MTGNEERPAASANGLRVAYLVLTHGMPDHLGRTIDALTDDGTDFFVHVDRKVAIEPFLAHRRPNVEFLDERLPVHWGEWQMVEATLRLIRRALERGRDYDYLVLLSGSCYPIRSRSYIRRALADHLGDQFISAVAMPNEAVGKSLARLERFHVRSDRSRLDNLVRFLSGFSIRGRSGPMLTKRWLLGRDWRRSLGSLTPYGGASWWALTGDACRYILGFVDRQPRVIRFFEHTRFPDEGLFHTILGNSPFAARMRRSLLYNDWSEGTPHPAAITEEHVRRFAAPGPMIVGGVYGSGEVCFARKFPDDAGRMVALVDEMVRAREPLAP